MRIAAMTIAVVVLTLSVLAAMAFLGWRQSGEAAHADNPGSVDFISIDMDDTGNGADAIGPRETCNAVPVGGELTIGVTIDQVASVDLMRTFQFDFNYVGDSGGPGEISVVAFDDVSANTFISKVSVPGSTSVTFPDDGLGAGTDTTSPLTVAAAKLSGTQPSGTGTLAHLTLLGETAGLGQLSLSNPTVTDGNNVPLTVLNLQDAKIAVGDVNGDTVVDINDCPVEETPTGTPGAGQETPGPTPRPGTPTPPPAALDADRDGAPDAKDQCPDTSTGASIDPSGCSDTQLKKLKQETRGQLLEKATAGLNLDVTLDTVVVGGSTDILAVFADQNDDPVSGVDITFKIEEQPGSDANLNVVGETEVAKTSDADGVAEAKLNVGNTPGEIVVSATSEGETETVTVTVVEAAIGPATGVGNLAPTGGSSIPAWAAVASALGGAALLMGGAALFWARRRQA